MSTPAENEHLDTIGESYLPFLENQFQEEDEKRRLAEEARRAEAQGSVLDPTYFVSTSGWLAAAYYGRFFPWAGITRFITSWIRR